MDDASSLISSTSGQNPEDKNHSKKKKIYAHLIVVLADFFSHNRIQKGKRLTFTKSIETKVRK